MAFLTLVNQGAGPDRRARPAARGRFSRRRRRPARRARRRLLEAADAVLAAARGDGAIAAVGWAGVALSLAGASPATRTRSCSRVLCALQISVVDVGQDFYGFGWEIQLRRDRLPLHLPLPAARRAAVPAPARRPRLVIWLLRWLILRIMLGAGLIKLRGDPCWRDLTCLDFHFETQPIPNPLIAARSTSCRTWAHKRGRAVQPRRRAGARRSCVFGPRRRVRLVGGRADGGAAARADRQRQPVVPELADAGADRSPASTTGCGGACCRASLVARAERARAARRAVARAGRAPWRRWASRSRCSASARS